MRESFDGTLELHLGKRAEVEISPKGVDESRFPHTAADLVERIRQITPAKRRASVQGLVTSMFPTSEFKRRDGTGGKVKRVRLRDETGEITIVLWNEKADELSTINEGDQLRITNTRVKQGLDGRIELHVENSSQIEKTASQTPSQPVLAKMPYKVVNLTEGGSFTVEGIVASTPLIREVTTSKGENVLLATFDLVDETGAIPVTMWRNHAEFARQLELGTRIRIENAYAKKGFSNPLELTSRSATTIEIAPQPEEEQTENKIE